MVRVSIPRAVVEHVTQFLKAEHEKKSRKEKPKHERRQIKLPGPDHPISIQRNPARVVVSVAGRVVADTTTP